MTVNEELATLAATLRRSTVQIRGRRGGGSGVIWRPDGLIVTNAHVVHRSQATVELADGRVYEAEVVQRDDRRDLAALKIAAADLPAVTVGNPNELRVGDLVLAIGNPFGQVGALTMGIVHALPIDQTWLQADIRLAPGNSGGALADAQGRVVGINTLIANGLGIAVPSDAVDRFLQGSRPRLGVTLQPVLVPTQGKQQLGLLILEVAIGSPAATSGLLPGDIVIGANDRFFTSPDDLSMILERSSEVRLETVRGGQRVTQQVTLGDRASEATAA